MSQSVATTAITHLVARSSIETPPVLYQGFSHIVCTHRPAGRQFVLCRRENHFAVCHPRWYYFRVRVIRLAL